MRATLGARTGFMAMGLLLMLSAAVRAQTAPELSDCLALDDEGDIRSCADEYVSAVCRPSPRSKFKEDHDARACVTDVWARVAARINAERSCVHSGQVSICTRLPDQRVAKSCYSRCLDARETTMHSAAEQEQAACESRYAEAGGHGKFTCTLPGAIAGIDLDIAKFDARMKAAAQARDLSALDDLVKQSDGQFLWGLQSDCTKACNERAPELLAVQKQGPARVTAYKRCMMAADSTLEARKLSASEIDSYCDYLRKADARCRAAYRCDWIEQLSDMQCTYENAAATCDR